ncbi:MAG: hypothetical protein LBE84_11630, partial [Planctomycetota bacterium]|nr:hypothetical protein [Planctomycetota bacterium]
MVGRFIFQVLGPKPPPLGGKALYTTILVVPEKVPSNCEIIGKLGKNRLNFGKNEQNILQGFDPSA